MNLFLHITLVLVVYLGIWVLNPYVFKGKTLSLLCNIQLLCLGFKYLTLNSNAQCITILPTYLQFTIMLAVAVAGVPTPLLAMHWYWILLFAVPGLVTFTIASSEALDRKSELPTLVHFMLGFGLLDVAHVKFKLLPSRTVFTTGKTVTFGVSDKRWTPQWIPLKLWFHMRNHYYHTTYKNFKRPIFFHEIEKHCIENFNAMNNQRHIEFEHW